MLGSISVKVLWTKLIHVGGVKIYVLLAGLVSLTLTARWLGPEGRGQVVAVTTWASAFSTFGHFSLGQVAIREATSSKNAIWLKDALGVLLINLMFFCSVGLIGYYYSPFQIDIFGFLPSDITLWTFIIVPFLILENYSNNLLMAIDKINIYNRFQVVSRTVSLILLPFLILYFQSGPIGALIANCSAFVIAGLGPIVYLFFFSGGINLPGKKIWIRYLKGGLSLHLNTIGTFLFSSGDVLMLNHLRNSSETGIYQLGVQLVSIMLIVPQSASMIFYSQVSVEGVDIAWQHQKKVIWQVVVLMVFASIMAAIYIPYLLPFVVGDKFNDSISIFRLQLIPMIAMSFCIVMSAQWIGRGAFLYSSMSALLVGLISIMGNRYFIPKFGMYGAVYSSMISYTIALLINGCMYVYCNKASELNRDIETLDQLN